jgi:hypothetical protein
MDKIVIEFTRNQALAYGLLVCVCRHPPNNHFDDQTGSCARCECKKYVEVPTVGKFVKKEEKSSFEPDETSPRVY